ncbi:beta-ketoacyl-[acyl-carrier-protein] synthase family protein [Streptomyces sp. NPDC002928]|uniref:beta-ketoacyl-[acyl-carrier-protein] synthase family protein n=1 Tax=Streptomyces sp. NPDC002928 TaxID=3154440 RepID=UPI00339F18A9
MTEVLITGAGAVSCLGLGVEAMWQALCAAPDSRPQRVGDPGARVRVPLFHLAETGPPPGPAPDRDTDPDTDVYGRASRLALTAAREAVADAGLTPEETARSTVVIGTGGGNTERTRRPLDPDLPYASSHTVASAVATALGSTGGAASVANACSASGYGLGMAMDMIRAGEAEVVVAGGAEAYARVTLGCFDRMGAVDPHACRPFHRDRKGTVFGEGAAVLVLESADHARRRGARRHYAKLAGAGWSCDAHHLTAPEPQGEEIRRAMAEALADAGASAESVGCVVPHGTGTRLNDVVESRVLGAVFGERVARLPVFSLKALTGHTAGAAGALGALTAALVLDRGTVPPNVALGDDQDPDCRLSLPQGTPVRLTGRHVLVNAFAFGGNNISLVLEGATP